MSRILIIDSGYDSQTIAISLQMADLLQNQGYAVDTVAIQDAHQISLDNYAGVLIGNSVHWGVSNSQIKDWVKRRKSELQNQAVGLFMMSSSSSSPQNVIPKSDRKVVESFIKSTGWYPTLHTFFANTLSFFREDPNPETNRNNVESFIEDFIIKLRVRTEESFGFAMVGEL